MAKLRGPNNTQIVLPYRCMVGRSPLAQLRLDNHLVSAEHAVIFYESHGTWMIRDLGSRNGTMVNGQPCTPGAALALNLNDRLSFGSTEEEWVIDEARAPEPCAYPQSGPDPCFGHDGLLLLPDESAPEASLYRRDQQWVAEWHDEVQTVASGDRLSLQSGTWLLLLPPFPETPSTTTDLAPFKLNELAVDFLVSQDEESVQLTLSWRGTTRKIANQSCLYVLLLLARERLAGKSDAPEGPGWIHPEVLATKLGCTREKLNVDIHRIRRIFQRAGVHDAAGIVERSVTLQALRIGASKLHIDRLE